MITSEQKTNILDGFIETMIDDIDYRLQDQYNIFGSVPVIIKKDQKQILGQLLDSVLVQIDLANWDYEENYHGMKKLGGDLYIGLMYDSLNTPINDLPIVIDYYCELDPYIDNETTYVEGYFLFNGIKYSL